jgi:hypothetical protein
MGNEPTSEPSPIGLPLKAISEASPKALSTKNAYLKIERQHTTRRASGGEHAVVRISRVPNDVVICFNCLHETLDSFINM